MEESQKPKAKPKPKNKPDKDQSARFIETARELQADESGSKFETAFSKIVPAPKTKMSGGNG